MIRKQNDQIYISELLILSILSLSLLYLPHIKINLDRPIDESTKQVCWERGLINKKAYAGSKWENMDFYKSCLMNATCNNPYQKCEVN